MMRTLPLMTACLLLQACAGSIQSKNYEFHVIVDTPQGPAEGRGVINVVYSYSKANYEGSRMPYINGEAVAIDLPGKPTFFMLMDTVRQSWSVSAPWVRGFSRDDLENGKKVSIDSALLPDFAYFKNNNVPSSIVRIDPAKLSAAFGNGYNIRSVYLIETKRPVTHYIIRRLPWLKNYKGSMSGNTSGIGKDQTYPESIYYWHFLRELNHN